VADAVELVASGDGPWRLNGALNTRTVSQAWAAGDGLPDAATVELDGLAEVDSAGLAVLVAWCVRARQQGGSVRLARAPAQLQALASVNGVGALLGLEPGEPEPVETGV